MLTNHSSVVMESFLLSPKESQSDPKFMEMSFMETTPPEESYQQRETILALDFLTLVLIDRLVVVVDSLLLLKLSTVR